METIRNHDKYLDPPAQDYHAICEHCGAKFELTDMTEVADDKYVCYGCIDYYLRVNKLAICTTCGDIHPTIDMTPTCDSWVCEKCEEDYFRWYREPK